MKDSLKNEWEAIIGNNSPEEEIAFKADLLAMQFLGIVDQKMEELDMSKKELAHKIGTSASFITQLFRGDRKPNWNTLAKMSLELGIEFKILSQDLLQEKVKEELMEYHQRWSKTQEYFNLKNQITNPHLVMTVIVEDDYAMAG